MISGDLPIHSVLFLIIKSTLFYHRSFAETRLVALFGALLMHIEKDNAISIILKNIYTDLFQFLEECAIFQN